MTGALTYSVAHHAMRVYIPSLVDDEPEVLLGRQAHHHPEPVPICGVEQRARRHGVGDSHRVEAVGHHLSEIPFDDVEVVILVSVRVRSERSIGDAAHIQLVVAGDQELTLDGRAAPAERFGQYRRCRRRTERRTYAGRALPPGSD